MNQVEVASQDAFTNDLYYLDNGVYIHATSYVSNTTYYKATLVRYEGIYTYTIENINNAYEFGEFLKKKELYKYNAGAFEKVVKYSPNTSYFSRALSVEGYKYTEIEILCTC